MQTASPTIPGPWSRVEQINYDVEVVAETHYGDSVLAGDTPLATIGYHETESKLVLCLNTSAVDDRTTPEACRRLAMLLLRVADAYDAQARRPRLDPRLLRLV